MRASGYGVFFYGGECEFEFGFECSLRLASILGDMVTPVLARIEGASRRRWNRKQVHRHRGHVPLAAGTANTQ